MTRKISLILLRTVSVVFILWGIFHVIFVFTVGRSTFDHPVALCILGLFYGSACILIGILSWKRSNCFKSSFRALLLLLARTFSFFLAYVLTFGVGSSIEAPRAHWTPEIRLKGGIIEGVLVLLFLSVTLALTLVNKEKSCKTQNSPKKRINTDRQ